MLHSLGAGELDRLRDHRLGGRLRRDGDDGAEGGTQGAGEGGVVNSLDSGEQLANGRSDRRAVGCCSLCSDGDGEGDLGECGHTCVDAQPSGPKRAASRAAGRAFERRLSFDTRDATWVLQCLLPSDRWHHL